MCRLGGGARLFGLHAARLLGFTLAPLLRQVFFLPLEQGGLAACIFLAPLQLGLLNLRVAENRHGLWRRGRHFFFALDEGALLAYLDLNRARAPSGVGLFDLRGRLLHQGDFLALTAGGAVAELEVLQQHLLVGIGQPIGTRYFRHTGGAELLQQQ